jgi:hypothetical protein
LALATPHVEDALGRRKLAENQRDDLLFVFGVDSAGETVDPPIRMLVPRWNR